MYQDLCAEARPEPASISLSGAGGGTLILVFMKLMQQRTENPTCRSWSPGAPGASQAHWSPQGAKLWSEVVSGVGERRRGAPGSPLLSPGLLATDHWLPSWRCRPTWQSYASDRPLECCFLTGASAPFAATPQAFGW